MAASWKSIDNETRDYCMKVVKILKERRTEIARRSTANEKTMTESGEIFCLPTMNHDLPKAVGVGFFSTIDSASQGPKERITRRITDRGVDSFAPPNFETVFCLPIMSHTSPGSQNETRRGQMQITMEATLAFGEPRRLSIGMNLPEVVSPVAHNEGTVNSYDIDRSCRATITPDINFGGSYVKTFQRTTPGLIQQKSAPINKEHKRHSAPERSMVSDREQSRGVYNIQELDIADSDVFGMWLSSIVQEEGQVFGTPGPHMAREFHVLEYLPEMQHMKQETVGPSME